MNLPLLALLTPLALLVSARASAAQEAAPLTERVDAVFARFQGPESPGCALAVMRDGRIVYSRGYGMADLQHQIPITPSSIFHVASVSKQFTTMSIALLAQQGVLSLDDDIRKYVPEVPDFGETITIRHLIHHTSGLRDQWSLLAMAGWRPDDPKTEADILDLVSRQRELNFRPGDQHVYNNTGYTLMAVIVKRVSGKSLREFAEERIFRPLGMTSTHFHDDHTMIVRGRTSAYEPREGGGLRISIPVFDNVGATSLFTTVEDLAKWDRNFVDARVGGPELLDRMHTRGRLNDGEEVPYAFALMHGEHQGLKTVGHSGADAGYRADFLRFPDQRLSVTALCNVSDANPGSLTRQVATLYLADEIRTAQRSEASSPPAYAASGAEPDLARYEGSYWDERTETLGRVVMRNGKLTVVAGRPTELVPLGNGRFVAQEDESARFAFRRLPGEGDMEMEYQIGGARPNHFRRMPPPEGVGERLARYAGTFHSPELGVDWTVAAVEGKLLLRRRKFEDQVLEPVFADAFVAPNGTILRFAPDDNGGIGGFAVSAGRVRHLRFERR